MKPESQRIAIAEFCGWDFDPPEAREWKSQIDNHCWCKSPNSVGELSIKFGVGFPDYLNDLNAIHEAEKLLEAHDEDTSTHISQANWEVRYGMLLVKLTQRTNPFHATAAQRSEALLKTIGKWTDT